MLHFRRMTVWCWRDDGLIVMSTLETIRTFLETLQLRRRTYKIHSQWLCRTLRCVGDVLSFSVLRRQGTLILCFCLRKAPNQQGLHWLHWGIRNLRYIDSMRYPVNLCCASIQWGYIDYIDEDKPTTPNVAGSWQTCHCSADDCNHDVQLSAGVLFYFFATSPTTWCTFCFFFIRAAEAVSSPTRRCTFCFLHTMP